MDPKEIPLTGGRFTWSDWRKHREVLQARTILISVNWEEKYANTRETLLLRLLYDHLPIMLDLDR